MTRIRLVHYVPDPFSGAKVTIGALVESGARVEFARSPWLPAPGCIGGRKSHFAMLAILDALASPTRFDLPSGEVSPLARLGEELLLPQEVTNPRAWVEKHLLPQKPANEADARETVPRGPHRDTLGQRFLEQWQVGQFVQRRYSPSLLPSTHAKAAQEISQFVEGRQELLLMEPIVGTRSQLEEDLRDISQEFLAFRELFRSANLDKRPLFIAYVMTRGHQAAVGAAELVLSKAADWVINVDDAAQRERFLKRIVDVGRSGTPQGTLPLQ
ncbi:MULTISPECIES: hypothetical protein [unclassified Myxococcus]|jgi:hypothetical protein|uniref:hypothetical protein n=1 Tax=unclassified Myxococcus TaxID=2648731 RepID=UPI001CBDAFCC|nr:MULTISPECIES: hypothetical protein [unclassified Myxococcus]MBZ4397848.1 hypothetical protein [Myxococcus sp. AS-1-15]MBZ4407588.1 hypothetical protein [Myxococcus sp. XM-1-1-1]